MPTGRIEDNPTDEDLELDTLIPDPPNQPYDKHEVITRILDDDELLEVQAGYALNIVVGFGRVDGRPVGIVANQPTQFAGCLDINASEKAARFVRNCNCFNIPIVDRSAGLLTAPRAVRRVRRSPYRAGTERPLRCRRHRAVRGFLAAAAPPSVRGVPAPQAGSTTDGT
jgi:hypothetical protein